MVTHDQIAITDLIGVGTTGVVYKAQQIRLGRTVAVKVLSKINRNASCDFRKRFMIEAKALARLDHPSIARIHDLGETKTGFPYLVMEYVEGINLAALICGGQLTLEHVASWIPQACEAVEYAHNHEMVHRNLKPASLLIDLDGRVKLTGFGLVKVKGLTGPDPMSDVPLLASSRSYMAPETLVEGAAVDHRADVFSMGVILYELLTGTVPKGPWKNPSAARPGVDPRFDSLVIRALQPDAQDRHSRIADLGREVLAVAGDCMESAGTQLLAKASGRRPGGSEPGPGNEAGRNRRQLKP